MLNTKVYCPNCGRVEAVKDNDGFYFCPYCNTVYDEATYEALLKPDAEFDKYSNVYPEVVIQGQFVRCFCGYPILEVGDGTFVCSNSTCGHVYSAEEVLQMVTE